MPDLAPSLARSTQHGCKHAPDSFSRGVIACLRPPRHEAGWPDEHSSARRYSKGSRTLARRVRHVVLAELINVKINSQRFGLIAGRLRPGIALGPRQQGEVLAEQIQRRNLLAVPLQPKVRGART